jgi:hypothetical protein
MAMPVVAPPGIPEDRKAVLVKAFDDMVANKNFINDDKPQVDEIDLNWNLLKMDFTELNPEEILDEVEW